MKKVKKELNDLMMFADEAREALKIARENEYDRKYFSSIAETKIENIIQEIEILNDK